METHYQWLLRKQKEYVKLNGKEMFLKELGRVAPNALIDPKDNEIRITNAIEDTIPLEEKDHFPEMEEAAKKDYDLITYLEDMNLQE